MTSSSSPSRVLTETDAYRRGTHGILSLSACPVTCTPVSHPPARGGPLSSQVAAPAIADRHANFRAAGAEMSRDGVFCALRRLIQSKCGTAWSSARALSYLHLPLVNLLFQPRFFCTFSSSSSISSLPLPPLSLPTLALLLRVFFNRPHVFFLGAWHANCRGRHVQNLWYGNSVWF